MKRVVLLVMIVVTMLIAGSCDATPKTDDLNQTIKETPSANDPAKEAKETPSANDPASTEPVPSENELQWIVSDGKNVVERINVPKGFERVETEQNSFAEFVREYPLKEDGSPVMLHNGSLKSSQDDHVAVFDMYLGERNLQQCADSVMRMYAEYYYQAKKYDKIKFHFVSGFLFEYKKWQKGYRVSVDGNEVNWVKKTGNDNSPEVFEKYLTTLFSYASTISLAKESKTIKLSELAIGDIFIKPGSPGHVVLVVDVCTNDDGEKAFLLAQGYMPAQSFHIIKNPLHEDDPWYYLSELEWPFITQEYTFPENSLMRIEW